MIRINLAKRKGAGVAVGAAEVEQRISKGFGALGELGQRFNIDISSLENFRDLPLKKPAAVVILAIVANYTLQSYQEEEIQKIEASIKKVAAEQVKLKGELDKTKGFEQIKKSLEGDELTIKTKIEVIQKLILDRQKPPKLLLALSNLIPNDVWLEDFKVSEGDLKLTGRALGLIQISDFMKNMSESADFTDVRLVATDTAKDGEGIEVTHFDITAKRR
jgi:Tfp pilus assembly protein PilN